MISCAGHVLNRSEMPYDVIVYENRIVECSFVRFTRIASCQSR